MSRYFFRLRAGLRALGRKNSRSGLPNLKLQIDPYQRDLRLIFQDRNPDFFAFYHFFPVIGLIDRHNGSPKRFTVTILG